MAENLPTVHETGVVPGERGRYVTNRRPLPEFAPPETAAYALWCKEATDAAAKRNLARAEQLKRKPGMHGKVLTERGWEIPSGPDNPRIIDQDSGALTPYEQAREDAIQAQVQHAAGDHEHAVKAADMWEFRRMYRARELPERFYA